MLNRELSHLSEMSRSGNQVSEYISNTFLGNHCSRSTSKRNCKVSRHRGLGRLPPACAKHQINSVNLQRRFETSLIWYGYETESPHSHCRDMRGEEGRLPSGGIRSDECRGGSSYDCMQCHEVQTEAALFIKRTAVFPWL